MNITPYRKRITVHYQKLKIKLIIINSKQIKMPSRNGEDDAIIITRNRRGRMTQIFGISYRNLQILKHLDTENTRDP